MAAADPPPVERGSIVVLLAFVAVCLGVSAIGTAITWSSIDSWYPALVKPAFTPPDWVFAPVWTAIYLMMAIAAWRIWGARDRRGAPLALFWFGAQLTLNLLWTVLFFGLRGLGLSLAESAALLAAVAVTTVSFFQIDRLAGWLFVPYLLWSGFAVVLNWEIWRLN